MPFFEIGMKTDLFQASGHCWVFQIFWHIECSTFTALSFRTWNSSTGIPSPPLTLFIAMLPKAYFTFQDGLHIPGCLVLGKWSHYCGYLGHEDLFLYSSSVYSCHLFLISSASVRSILFLSFIKPIFAGNIPLVSLIWNILLFSSISFRWSLRKDFLSLLAIPCYSYCRWSRNICWMNE